MLWSNANGSYVACWRRDNLLSTNFFELPVVLRRVRPGRTDPGTGLADSTRNLVEIRASECEIGCVNPAIDLLGRTRADDSGCHARPAEGPRDCDRRNRRPMSLRDGLQSITQGEVALQVWRVELWSAASPVVLRHLGESFGAECIR